MHEVSNWVLTYSFRMCFSKVKERVFNQHYFPTIATGGWGPGPPWPPTRWPAVSFVRRIIRKAPGTNRKTEEDLSSARGRHEGSRSGFCDLQAPRPVPDAPWSGSWGCAARGAEPTLRSTEDFHSPTVVTWREVQNKFSFQTGGNS